MNISTIENFEIKYLDICENIDNIDFNILPKSIEELKIHGSTKTPINILNEFNLNNLKKLSLRINDFNQTHIGILSDSIEYLDIEISDYYKLSDINYIVNKFPNNLKDFSLTYRSVWRGYKNPKINLTNLPNTITKLKLNRVNTEIEKLPDSIQTLYLDKFDFTSNPIIKYPLNLAKLLIVDKTTSRKKPFGVIPENVKILGLELNQYTYDVILPESIEKIITSDIKIVNIPDNLQEIKFIKVNNKNRDYLAKIKQTNIKHVVNKDTDNDCTDWINNLYLE